MGVMATRSHDYWEHDDHDNDDDKESLRKAGKEKEDNNDDSIVLGNKVPAIGNSPQTIKNKMQMMLLSLSFSQPVAQKLVEVQVIDFP